MSVYLLFNMVWVTQEQAEGTQHTSPQHWVKQTCAHLKDYLQPQSHHYKIQDKNTQKMRKCTKICPESMLYFREWEKRLTVYRITAWKRHSWPACSTAWQSGYTDGNPALPMEHHCCLYMATASVAQPSVELQNLLTTSLSAARAYLAL